MKLGTLNLNSNLLLAPMENYTTGAYRRFCRKFSNIGLVYVPMIHTKQIMKSPKTIAFELSLIHEERPISIQLMGADIEAMKKSLEYLESFEFDSIDINCCCPSKRAIELKAGGYLLKDLKTFENLLNIAKKYTAKPVSAKIRLGFDNLDNVEEICEIINKSGIDFVAIHARLVKDMFKSSTLNLEALKRYKKLLTIPVVGNGDIVSPQFAKLMLDFTKVDALMIGRGSLGNPEIFRQIDEYLTKGIETSEKRDITSFRHYLETYQAVINDLIDRIKLKRSETKDIYRYKELRRNSICFTTGVENSTMMRVELSKTKNLNQLEKVLCKIS